jgi:hypothetical protein
MFVWLGDMYYGDEPVRGCKARAARTASKPFLQARQPMRWPPAPLVSPPPPPQEFNCNPSNANASACRCESTWMKQPPYMCEAGELDNAREKMVAQVWGRCGSWRPSHVA